MVPHLNSGRNDRHFLLLIPGPASLAPKSSLCIKLGPSSFPLKKKKKFFFFFVVVFFHRRRIIGADGQTVSALLPDARVKEVSPPAHSGAQSVCVYVCVPWPTVSIAAPWQQLLTDWLYIHPNPIPWDFQPLNFPSKRTGGFSRISASQISPNLALSARGLHSSAPWVAVEVEVVYSSSSSSSSEWCCSIIA